MSLVQFKSTDWWHSHMCSWFNQFLF